MNALKLHLNIKVNKFRGGMIEMKISNSFGRVNIQVQTPTLVNVVSMVLVLEKPKNVIVIPV